EALPSCPRPAAITRSRLPFDAHPSRSERQQLLNGRTGLRAELEKQIDEEARAAYCAKIEQAARSAAPIKA
ncbi:hypothetical protein ACFY2C_43800, partial [Streptomyces sp. NPDC001435]